MSDLKIDVDVSGLERLIQQEPQRVDAWLRGVAEQMSGDIKLRFNTGPAGITYERGPKNKRGAKTHVASSPGSSPNSDTGALRASIGQAPAGRLKYHIGASGIYAAYLEQGTSKMAARPYIGPVFADWTGGKIEDDAKQNLDLE